MTERSEGRLARWSRLKRAQGGRDQENSGPGVTPGQPAFAGASREASARPTEQKSPPATTVPELPPITELNKDSDFRPFLRASVPEGLHREALRALWRSDPAFAFRDGLTDYDEDYTAIGIVEQAVRTAYQAGQGYLNEAAPAPEERVNEEREAVATVSPGSSGTEAPSAEGVRGDIADVSDDEASRVPAESAATFPLLRNRC